MAPNNPLATRVLAGLAVFALALTGCGGPSSSGGPPTDAEEHMQRFRVLYQAYRDGNKGKPPQSVDQLKAWVKKQPKEKLAHAKVDDLDAACASSRDKEPFVLLGVPAGPVGMESILFHEAKGVGGRRLVMSGMGRVREADEDQFKALLEASQGQVQGRPQPKPKGKDRNKR